MSELVVYSRRPTPADWHGTHALSSADIAAGEHVSTSGGIRRCLESRSRGVPGQWCPRRAPRIGEILTVIITLGWPRTRLRVTRRAV
jgi:hypothetical protein